MYTYYTFGEWIVKRTVDWEEGDPQSFIAPIEENAHYIEYLDWVAKGNTAGVIADE